MIYGVATLAGCMIGGMLLGEIFGEMIGAGTEVGGVGFAILLLVCY